MPLIDMQAVSLKQAGNLILKQLDWRVEQGQTWAILGLNGSGKTSLLKLLMAEHWPTSGQIQVLGTNFGQGNVPDLRQKIGVVGSFITERLPKQMLAEKIVLTGKYKSSILYKAYGDQELNQAKDMLVQLGAEQLIGRTYVSLSQGEKQLVLIARSLMENPAIIILDEATSGLDLFAREKLLQQIAAIRRLPQAPLVLYVTHHAEEITKDMSHVLLLKDGRIFAQGPKEQVLTQPVLSGFYDHPIRLLDLGEERIYIKVEKHD